MALTAATEIYGVMEELPMGPVTLFQLKLYFVSVTFQNSFRLNSPLV